MSEFVQKSFIGGMNLILDDCSLKPDEYRVAFNLRNRYDSLEPVLSSKEDTSIPVGIIQEVTTFGNYLIAFVSGKAYYRFYSNTGWTPITGFAMSTTAPRYWTKAVPVATTLYARLAVPATINTTDTPNAAGGVFQLNNIAGASGGNLPGLLVQDNANQPQFIFLDINGVPTVRVTQAYNDWSITFDTDGTTVLSDNREYVPIGNFMEYIDGILYITDPTGGIIYRSVSGRPLDFVININLDGTKGGDASTTAYSVGVGGITCLRLMSDGSLFVAAGLSACFSVGLNKTPNAPTIFGEYTFTRKFLFNSSCLSDRAIMDALGDTYFVDLNGARSFNAILQLQNEGRNSVFTKIIQSAFTNIIQSASASANILFDNYALFAMNTVFGYAIAVYDTLNQDWSAFDTLQTGGVGVKMFVKLEIQVQRLYAVTVDNKLFELYAGPNFDTTLFRSQSISANVLSDASDNIKQNNPRLEIKPREFRCILNNVTSSCSISVTPFVNNRLTMSGVVTKPITYEAPARVYNGILQLPDVNTQLSNIIFPTPNCEQGWKCFMLLSWTGSGNVTQFSAMLDDVNPMNPLQSQGLS